MMKIRRILSYLLLSISLSSSIWSQDIDKMLEEATGSSTQYTAATFKSTRIINGHSIERMQAGQLDVRISHRFGPINSGSYNLWGLDQANMHLGMEYGITNWVMVGLGRGTYEKAYDGFLKFSLLRQSKGDRNMPVSVSLFTSTAYSTIKLNLPGSVSAWDRMSYVAQLLVARKFNERFSFEINPTYVHRNMVSTEVDPNDTWSAGAGFRFKITKRMSLNAEYYYIIPPRNDFRSVKTYNPLAIGVDIETGGHVFTIMLTNSVAMIEKGFIGETTEQWKGAGIHLGFNLSRVFTLK
jgi:opacity protein-like surface antigen